MLNIGPLELLVILLVALVVVGPERLPELGRTIGRGLREFRKAQDELRDTLKFNLDDEPVGVPTARPHVDPASAQPDANEIRPEPNDDEVADVTGIPEIRSRANEVAPGAEPTETDAKPEVG